MDGWKRGEGGKAVNDPYSNELRSNFNDLREQGQCSSSSPPYYLDKFTLYKNSSCFYMTGRDVNEKHWRVLRIGRAEPLELKVNEDSETYSTEECKNLLYGINGLKCVVGDCYGIIGFIKSLQTYYILLITKRREIGKICGHPIYSIAEYRTIPICRSNRWNYVYNSTRETRYRKLLEVVDIRDNFFFSWSYPLMHRLQRNLSKQKMEHYSSDRTMFIWNKYLTDQTRSSIGNSLWTVALIHGFFKQAELCAGGKTFVFTLIARRSCQSAGTRYEKRGVDDNGQAANDVEIEQIVCQHVSINSECSREISSAVQIRGSTPLSWSQKIDSLTMKRPKILYTRGNYKATQLHFESLRQRYGVPQIILSLLKKSHNKPDELIMNNKFQTAINIINQGLAEDDQVEFLSLDLDAAFKDKNIDELTELKGLVEPALKKTGFFSCKMPQSLQFKALSDLSYTRLDNDIVDSLVANSSDGNNSSKLQQGILRANCLDSLDRTNVAQYVYGLVALGHQLNTLKLIGPLALQFNDPLAYDLMNIYQAMGDALSQQYAGSAAHQKIFAKIRGQYSMAARFQEMMKSVQRQYRNSFTDGAKQQAIDFVCHMKENELQREDKSEEQKKKLTHFTRLLRFLGHLQPDNSSINPSKRNSDQEDICEWLKARYLKSMIGCVHSSGFVRLGGSSQKRMIRPSGSSHQGSQEGQSMRNFASP